MFDYVCNVKEFYSFFVRTLNFRHVLLMMCLYRFFWIGVFSWMGGYGRAKKINQQVIGKDEV